MIQLPFKAIHSRLVFTTSIVIWSFLSWGQTSFSVDTTNKYHRHEANDLVFYMNIPIHNNTGQDLKMGFERRILYLSPSWKTNVLCVDSFYAPTRDSGTFWLPKDFTFNSLIACYFYPNKTIGSGMVEVKVFNYQNPADSVVLTFGGETFILAGLDERNEQPNYSLNRFDSHVRIQANNIQPELLEVYDLSGRLIVKQPWPAGVSTLVCSPPTGVAGLAVGRIYGPDDQASIIRWVW